MRFQVPQFIDVEDKIFGPMTFKQFIYVVGGIGICVIFFILLPRFLAIVISLPVIIFSSALAFYRVNGKPFVSMVEAFVKYFFTNKLYIWKKGPPSLESYGGPKDKTIEQIYVPKLSDSKLKELTWSLDVKANQNPITEDSDSQL